MCLAPCAMRGSCFRGRKPGGVMKSRGTVPLSFRRRFQRERDPVERLVRRDIYYSALRKYKCHIAKAKDSAIRKFCDENTRKCLFSEPYKLAFQKLRSVLSPLLRPDGTYTASPEQSAGLLLGVQIRQDDAASDSAVHIRERELPYPANDVEFTELVRPMKLRSACGLDRLTPSMVQSFFRLPFFFPKVWRQGRVVFLPKPGRRPESPTSYRPICINSVFGKVLERLLNSRLYHFLASNNLLDPFQFGFTHSKNTTAGKK